MAPPEVGAGEPRRPRVLIIDDSELVLDLLRAGFVEAGVEVHAATSLDQFEALRASLSPDLLLLDVQMPEAWGDDLATTLRGAYGVDVPILLMSSLPPEELEARAAAAGIDGWVSKRSGLDIVVGRVLELLRGRAAAPPGGAARKEARDP